MLSETQKETRIQKLIETEWELFQHVHNEGGRAACQDDWNTFRIMRHCQFAMWPEKVLSSYQTDLDTAKSQGRNLITEKYARMMASTDPEEYRRLEPFLPALTSQAEEITEEILSLLMVWLEEYAEHYPALSARGRRLHSSEDTKWDTSAETYLRGELQTYSVETLQLYLEYLTSCAQKRVNVVEKSDTLMVQEYGYSSLEDAQAHLNS